MCVCVCVCVCVVGERKIMNSVKPKVVNIISYHNTSSDICSIPSSD